jgi:cyclic beta-1,2-glucan synthetase
LLAPVELGRVDEQNSRAAEAVWFAARTSELMKQVANAVADYMPWLLAEFAPLRDDVTIAQIMCCDHISIARLPECIEQLLAKLEVSVTLGMDNAELRKELMIRLPAARLNALRLVEQLRSITTQCERMIHDMEFSFLLDRRRKLLSIGYDGENEKVHAACYDLLASEARIAAFVAVAKDDIPQESWFQMSRSHVVVDGRACLISWTGTMFEYLMPMLWMRALPDTMLEKSKQVAVFAQQLYADDKGIPWGISECAYAKVEDNGAYGYRAFGVPQLALQQEEERLVVAPYATMLAIPIDPAAAIRNLRWMTKKKWFGAYGYYEAADFTRDVRPSRRQKFALVRSWMVHHQGMGLLAITNFLRNDIVQQWFRRDARVQATELLLQERPAGRVAGKSQKSSKKQKTVKRKASVTIA